jgi:hypothetical protein
MGRLHRHIRPVSHRPEWLRQPRCVVIGVRWFGDGLPKPTQATRIYGMAPLLRSAALVREVLDGDGVVRLPDDIGPLVQRAYSDEVPGPTVWQEAIADADTRDRATAADQESRAGAFLLQKPGELETLDGLLDHHDKDVERDGRAQAQVRDSEDSIEVLLLPRVGPDKFQVPRWFDGELAGAHVSVDSAPDPEVARELARCAVRLPLEAMQGKDGDKLLDALRTSWFRPWQDLPELRGQVVLPLDEEPRPFEGYVFTYTAEEGLDVKRDE